MGLAGSSHSTRYGPGTGATYSIQHPSRLQREKGSTSCHVYSSVFRVNRALLGNKGQACRPGYLLEGFNQSIIGLHMDVLPLHSVLNVLILHRGKGNGWNHTLITQRTSYSAYLFP